MRQALTTKNYVAQNISGAKVEKSWSNELYGDYMIYRGCVSLIDFPVD